MQHSDFLGTPLASSEEFFGFFIKLSAANLGTKPRLAGEKEIKEWQIH